MIRRTERQRTEDHFHAMLRDLLVHACGGKRDALAVLLDVDPSTVTRWLGNPSQRPQAKHLGVVATKHAHWQDCQKVRVLELFSPLSQSEKEALARHLQRGERLPDDLVAKLTQIFLETR